MQGHRFRRFQPLEKLPAEPSIVPNCEPQAFSCGNTTPSTSRSRSGGRATGRLSALVQSVGSFIHRRKTRNLPSKGSRRSGSGSSNRCKFLKLKHLTEGAKKVWGLKCLRPRVRLSWSLKGPAALLRRLKESYVPMMIAFASSNGKIVEVDTVSCQYCCRRGFQPEVLCKHCKETSSRVAAAHVRRPTS